MKMPGVLLKRLLLFAGLWLLLTKGDLSSWVVGVVAVSAATGLSMLLAGPSPAGVERAANSRSVNILGVLRFIPFFVWQSLRGGWQTARLALHPSLPLQPGFIDYQTCLPCGSARYFFLHLISLMPGTLSAQFIGDKLRIHALTDLVQSEQDLQQCERRVAQLFQYRDADYRTGASGGNEHG